MIFRPNILTVLAALLVLVMQIRSRDLVFRERNVGPGLNSPEWFFFFSGKKFMKFLILNSLIGNNLFSTHQSGFSWALEATDGWRII